MLQNGCYKNPNFENLYERFIKSHLRHYGYFCGQRRNMYTELDNYLCENNSFCNDDEDKACSQNRKEDDNKMDTVSYKTTQLILKTHENGKAIFKLKEPLSQEFVINFQERPRWPIEMEVLPEPIIHIRNLPNEREPLYKSTGEEIKIQSNGAKSGKLVYEYLPFSDPFFIRSKTAPKLCSDIKLSKVAVELSSNDDETLLFESRFESANLEKVYQIGHYEYELHLRTDLYTDKHIQWYYFQIKNTRAGKQYRFTIVNFYKSNSLYNEGLRPLLYSEKDANQYQKGWRRCGSNICYYMNNRKYETAKGYKNYYSLTWTVEFPHNRDTVYMAHCYPYTYSDMMHYVEAISKSPRKSAICTTKLLGRTLANNSVPLLTITNNLMNSELEKKKKVIIITGRVHPGESNASWMMEGVLDFLLDNTPDSNLLRDMFLFKVVPMLNPDGVIVGNYRCSLTGRDLNRNYRTNLKESYPVIYRLRNLIESLWQERDVLMYCDLHGHSRKQNIFLYGNNNQKEERDYLLERALSMLISKNAEDKFNYNDCRFKMQKSKAGTSRIVFRNLGIPHSFTIEASFCGSTLTRDNTKCSSTHSFVSPKNGKHFHFNTKDFMMIGEAFGSSLLDYFDPNSAQLDQMMEGIKGNITNKYINHLKGKGVSVANIDPKNLNVTEIPLSDIDSSDDDDDNGSDSSDSNGLPAHLEYEVQMRLSNANASTKKAIRKHRQSPSLKDENNNSCLQSRKTTSSVLSHHVNPKTKFIPNSELKFRFKSTTPKPLPTSSETENVQNTMMSTTKTFFKESEPSYFHSEKKINQEMKPNKIFLRYSTNDKKIANENGQQDNVETFKEKNLQITPKSGLGKVFSGNTVDEAYKFATKNPKKPEATFITNTFQVFSFNPHSVLDPHQKCLYSFYQNHTDLNRRLQAISITNKKGIRKGSEQNSLFHSDSNKPFLTFNGMK